MEGGGERQNERGREGKRRRQQQQPVAGEIPDDHLKSVVGFEFAALPHRGHAGMTIEGLDYILLMQEAVVFHQTKLAATRSCY